MNTLIYAASDDVVEVEGALTAEFSNPDFAGGAYVYTSAGHVLRFRLEDEGWRAQRVLLDGPVCEITTTSSGDDCVLIAEPLAWVVATTVAPRPMSGPEKEERPAAPLAFIDTETDGVHPDRRVWEVAVIRREPDGRGYEQQMFVDLGDLSLADPFGLRVGRYFERHPHGRALASLPVEYSEEDGDPVAVWSPGRAAREVVQMTHGAHLVGAVPNFDAEVLAGLLRRHGLIPTWHYHLVDVEALAVGWVAAAGHALRPPWSSDRLTEVLGVPPASEQERHTALGDARWAQRIYDRVMNPPPKES